MKLTLAFLTLVVALLLGAASLSLAQGPGYALTRWTVDGGGYTFSSGGGYTLGGTTGQPDAGLLSGGSYTLGGGFWPGREATQYNLYLPAVLRNY